MPKVKSTIKSINHPTSTHYPSDRTKPYTPARTRWFNLLKPAIALGKRARSHSRSHSLPHSHPNSNPIAHTHTHALPPTPIALQTDDPTSDAVIITALPRAPFCCHDELLALPRPALLAAAAALNARLPAALAIPPGADADVRRSIEVLVGLRAVTPAAPKAQRVFKYDPELNSEHGRSPPVSPLASRSRSQDLYSVIGSPPLARLKEEDEHEFQCEGKNEDDGREESRTETIMVVDRPAKRRRVSAAQEPPSPTLTPRLSRAHTHTGSMRGVDTAFVTTVRPRYRFRFRGSTDRPGSRGTGMRGGEQARMRTREEEVTAGLDEMSMRAGGSASSMDISSD